MDSLLKFGLLTLLLSECAHSAAAEELPARQLKQRDSSNNSLGTIEEVLVSAPNLSNDLLARNVNSLDEKLLFQSGAIDIPGVLAALPNINTVSFGSNGKRKNIDIRGSGDTSVSNVAVLLDGQRLGVRDQGGTDFSSIPIAQIGRIEVIRGSNVVRYGSGAAQGLIKIHRRKLEETPAIQLSHQQGNFGFSQSDLFTGKLFAADGRVSQGLSLYGNSLETDGYRQHDRLDSDQLEVTYRLQTSSALSSNQPQLSLGINYNRYRDDYQLPGPLDLSDVDNGNVDRRNASGGELLGGSVDQDNYLVNLRAHPNDLINFALLASRQDREDGIFREDALTSTVSRGLLTSQTEAIRGELTFKTGSLTQRLGLEHEDQSVRRVNEISPGATELSAATQVRARYYQAIVSFKKSASLSVGYRQDGTDVRQQIGLYQLFVSPAEKSFWENEAFEFNAEYEFRSFGTLSATAAKTFRNPNADELALTNNLPVSATSNSILRAGDLLPQEAERYEVGFESPDNDLQAAIYLFKTVIRDEIIFRNGNSGAVNGNLLIPSSRQGLEFNLSGSIGQKLALKLSGGLQNARLQNSNRIPLVPEKNFSISAIFQGDQNSEFSLVHRYIGNRVDGNDFSNSDVNLRLRSYEVLNASFRYRFELASAAKAVLFMQFENLLNERYASASYDGQGYPQPLRAFRSGIRIDL